MCIRDSGHTASGYWIDNDRKTTITGLYAAGDVAGGCPQKYVTGALVEMCIRDSDNTLHLQFLLLMHISPLQEVML